MASDEPHKEVHLLFTWPTTPLGLLGGHGDMRFAQALTLVPWDEVMNSFLVSWGNYDLTKKINFSNYPTPRSKTSPHSFFTFLAFCFGAWASCVFTCDLLVGTETCLWRARTFCCTLYDNVERRICNFKSLRIRLHDLDFGAFLWCANSDANHGRLTGTTACCKRFWKAPS